MAIKDRKITDAQILQHGVCAAPDKLEQSAAENKSIFDRLVKNVVQGAHNGLIEELCSVGGAANVGTADGGTVQGHLNSQQNPHGVTKAQVGLALADNTADLDKPISNAQAAVNAQKADKADTFTKAQTLAQIDQKVVEVGTGDMAQAVYDPHHHKQDLFGTFSNQNLIMNWDFTNPVNQRGKASYTGAVYGIDRWKGMYGSEILEIENGRIKLTFGNNQGIQQRFENYKQLAGKTVTLSILWESAGSNYFGTAVSTNFGVAGAIPMVSALGKRLDSVTFAIPQNISELNVSISGDGSCYVYGVKLEIGSVSTLAQDAPADYGEELARCQRYYENLGSFRIYKGARNPWSMASELSLYPFKATKRTLPTVKFKYMRSDSGGTAVSGTASHSGFDGFVDYNCVFDCDYVDFTEVFADAEIY